MITFTTDMELDLLDVMNIMSFYIGLQNLELNLTQDSLDKQTAELDARVNEEINSALRVLQDHLEVQDKKIDSIIREVKEIRDERLFRNSADA